MATRLYFTDNQNTQGSVASPGVHRGYQPLGLDGTLKNVAEHGLGLVRQAGGSGTSVTSVAGPTPGLELGFSGTLNEYVSMPLAADVTISGNVTLNIWGRQPADVNATINVLIERQTPDGVLTGVRIATSTNSTELTVHASTNGLLTTTFGVINTAWKKGDRIRAVLFFDDVVAGTMVAGQSLNVQYGAGSDGVNGDSYIEFTENLTFYQTEPTGSLLYLTDTDTSSIPPGAIPLLKELSSTPGSGVVTATRNTAAGWTAPLQWQKIGQTIEWYTLPLSAFTLDGLVRFNLRASNPPSGSNNASLKAELAVCDRDGSNAVVWCAGCIIDTATPGSRWVYDSGGKLPLGETAMRGWMAGNATAVAAGKRLRLRVYVDDSSNAALTGSGTVSLHYNGDATSGDSWIQLPQTVAWDGSAAIWYGTITTVWDRWYTQPPAAVRRTSALSAVASVTTLTIAATISTIWAPAQIGPDESTLPVVPVNPSTSQDQAPYGYGIRVTVLTAGQVSAIRFRRPPGALPSSRFVGLWSDAGALLASGTSSAETPDSWVVVPISPVAVTVGQVIRVSYAYLGTTLGGSYLYSYSALAGGISPNLRVDNICYAYQGDPTAFPDYLDTSPHYFADLVYQTVVGLSSWNATATATVFTPFTDWPGTISTNWGTWTATSTAGVNRVATSTQSWGTWNAQAVAVRTLAATATQSWGTWTGTSTAVVAHTATSTQSWGTWVSTVTAVVGRAATAVMTWGSWTTTFTAVVGHPATISTNWGTWNAQASATAAPPFIPAVINSNWGTWVSTASARRTSEWSTASAARTDPSFSIVSATITSNWGPLITSATAVVGRAAAVTTNWGAWTATAVIAVIERNATISTNWGTWLATAGGTDEHPSTITSVWGTWTATATAVVNHVATGASTWGTWTAAATAQPPEHPATIASNWGGWTATAVAGVEHPATIVTVWSWTATATAVRTTSASIATSWGTWSATANALREAYASITTSWGTWASSATALVSHAGTIASNWGTWTATANGTLGNAASITTNWGTWVATATAVREMFATSTSVWSWTATATPAVDKAATINTVWAWQATATATVVHTSTITTTWGTWNAQANADPISHAASINTNWGAWNASALGSQEGQAVAFITTVWPAWTATATAQPILHYATVNTVWSWTTTAIATVSHPATITTNWSDGALLIELFGGGADGVVMTTNNTVFNFLSGTPEFDTAVTYKVPQSMRVLNDAVARYGRRDNLNAPSCAFSIYVRFGSIAPAVNTTFIAFRDSLGTNTCAFNLNTVGRIVVADTTGTTIVGANVPAHAVLANNWYRVDGLVNIGASTGRAQYRICDVEAGDTDNPIAAPFDSLANKNLGATNIGRWYVGASSAVARNGEWNLAIARYDEMRTTFFNAYQGWTATAVADPIQRNATVASNWGTWTASATAVRATTASVNTNWGAWTAAATATIVAEEVFATVSTNWGTWTAAATGVSFHTTNGQITTNWGTWSASAAAGLNHPASITTTWTWTATAVADAAHVGSISTTWGTLTATASATVEHIASITTTWAWTATATAKRETWATISTTWDATFTASAVVNHWATGYSNFGRWEATAFGIAAPRGTTLNEADMVYLGDEEVDRIFLDGVIVWELV